MVQATAKDVVTRREPTGIEMMKTEPDAARMSANDVMSSANMRPEIHYYIARAVGGDAQGALDDLLASEIAWQMQPLLAGLRMFLGEDRVQVGREFNIMELEVGDDVAERIRRESR